MTCSPHGGRGILLCFFTKHVRAVFKAPTPPARSLRAPAAGARRDAHTNLVDVRQRVGQHPTARIDELTPRLWKLQFAANPKHSDVYPCRA